MLLPQLSFELIAPADEIRPDASLTIGMVGGVPYTVSPIEETSNLCSNPSATAFSETSNPSSTELGTEASSDEISGSSELAEPSECLPNAKPGLAHNMQHESGTADRRPRAST